MTGCEFSAVPTCPCMSCAYFIGPPLLALPALAADQYRRTRNYSTYSNSHQIGTHAACYSLYPWCGRCSKYGPRGGWFLFVVFEAGLHGQCMSLIEHCRDLAGQPARPSDAWGVAQDLMRQSATRDNHQDGGILFVSGYRSLFCFPT